MRAEAQDRGTLMSAGPEAQHNRFYTQTGETANTTTMWLTSITEEDIPCDVQVSGYERPI